MRMPGASRCPNCRWLSCRRTGAGKVLPHIGVLMRYENWGDQMSRNSGSRRWLPKAAIAAGILVAGAITVPVASAAPTPTGFIKVCKAASGAGVTGSFQFTINGVIGLVTVPVGGCSQSIKVAHGDVKVAEVARDGYAVAAITTSPVSRLAGRNLAEGKATVRVPAGG